MGKLQSVTLTRSISRRWAASSSKRGSWDTRTLNKKITLRGQSTETPEKDRDMHENTVEMNKNDKSK